MYPAVSLPLMNLQTVSLAGVSLTAIIDECIKKDFKKLIGFITLGSGVGLVPYFS